MIDFVADGQPFETPLAGALPGYAATPPSTASALGAMFGEGSPLGYMARARERARYYPLHPEGELGLELPPEIPSPTLSPEEYNAKYAPLGADGKRVSLGDKPMPEGAAQLVGKAKADEIERNGIIDRFSAAHSFPVNFGLGMAGFLLDPLNAATAFIPGIGEEAVLARLGGGLAARMTARVVSGGTAGAAGQAPLSAIRYGLGQQEASDYGVRDAFRDMLFAAAGNAVIHAGFGGLREAGILKPDAALLYARKGTEGAEASPPVSAGSLPVDAVAQHDAMRVGIASIAEGRPVDVMPVVDERNWHLMSEEARLRQSDAQLKEFLDNLETGPKAEASRDTLARLEAVERQLADETLDPTTRRTLQSRRDELLTDTNPETLHEAAAPLELRRQAESERDNIAARLQAIAAERGGAAADTALSPLPKLAEAQSALYREGFSPGIAATEARALDAAVYGPKEKPAGEPEASRETPAPATPKATGETDQALAEAEARLKAAGAPPHPEDAAELERATQGIADADTRGQMMQEAAACLAGGAA